MFGLRRRRLPSSEQCCRGLLVAIFGLGAIVAGVFRMDPVRGYPPGAPTGTPTTLTWHHQVHDLAGPVMFLAIFGACLALVGRLQGPWRLYTVTHRQLLALR